MENSEKVKSIIEALLIVSEHGLSREDLKAAIPDSDPKDIEEGIKLLKQEYEGPVRAFNIAEIAGKCRIVTKPEYMPWIGNLYQKDVDRLTGPSLETLAIIAYKQPATRAEVESVRGVNIGGVLKTLLEKDLILVKGRKDVAGRPLMYGTTGKFLEIFGLNSLDDLPILRDFSEEDLEYGKPQEQVELEPGGKEEPAVEQKEVAPGELAEERQAEREKARQDVEQTEEEIPEADLVETEEKEPESISEAVQESENLEDEKQQEEHDENVQEAEMQEVEIKETDNEAEKTE